MRFVSSIAIGTAQAVATIANKTTRHPPPDFPEALRGDGLAGLRKDESGFSAVKIAKIMGSK